MIIVSQNKEEIYNFEKISCLSIGQNYHQSTNEKDFTYDIYIEGVRSIGSYPSLDRAKEILKEILEYYHKLERGKVESIARNWMFFSEKMYFEMPEK